jgi:hypothetical protein
MLLTRLAQQAVAGAVMLAHSASAINCNADQLDKYRFKEVFTAITASSQLHDTPPSQTNVTWYFNLCDQVEELTPECPKHAQICGVQEVLLPGQDPIKTQVISFGNGLNYKVTSANDSDVVIDLDETSWGTNSINAVLNLHCAAESDPDAGIKVDWNDIAGDFTLFWNTPAACLKSNKEVPVPPKDGDSKKTDESWGWFTWLFIIIVLVVGSYIVVTAWISSSRTPADFQDAAHDFLETLKSLPALAVEVFKKIVGSGERGGYSAV